MVLAVSAVGVRQLTPHQQLVQILRWAAAFHGGRLPRQAERRHVAIVQVGRHAADPVPQRVVASRRVARQTLPLERLPALVAGCRSAPRVRHGAHGMVDLAGRHERRQVRGLQVQRFERQLRYEGVLLRLDVEPVTRDSIRSRALGCTAVGEGPVVRLAGNEHGNNACGVDAPDRCRDRVGQP